MYHFNRKPSIGMKVRLLQMLKSKLDTRSILRPRIEENSIISICNDLGICGGGLVFEKEQPEYLLCFLDKGDYSPENIARLDQAIREEFPDIKGFDIVSAERIYD